MSAPVQRLPEMPRSVTGGEVNTDWAALRRNTSALRPSVFAMAKPEMLRGIILRVGKRGIVDLHPDESRQLAAQLIQAANEIEQRREARQKAKHDSAEKR